MNVMTLCNMMKHVFLLLFFISRIRQPDHLAGVISYQKSGEPGQDNATFFIRGVTTFGYAKSPLILLDGFEMSANDLARVEPDNIAQFSVLKDATAAALYRSKGANGVIMVTTN